MEGGNIKAINRNSVHKICSGQVILTLATAVKELVENSLDSGATIIEVKLTDYGSELIEVIDNGRGVKPCDFQNLTLKHHTSKIQDFSDVPFVSTFGFRGEALSSLCALSNLEIMSCHTESPVGSQLTFDHNGMLVKNTPMPRQVGTTVTLKNLFSTLPVRHKEFLRNIRREYGKMIHLLTAYCLITLNKRITCTNITTKGKKMVVLSNSSADSIKDNILHIFGSKQVKNLLEIVQHDPSTSVLEEYFLNTSAVEKRGIFKLEGFVSSSSHGEGRSSTDRQFFFINGRPCDVPKVSKLINEVYHLFNKNQYPFVILNIVLTEGSADVNVTPDKRQIFILEEKLLLAIIKTTLLQMYENQPSQMKLCSANNLLGNQKLGFTPLSSPISSSQSTEGSSDLSLKRSMSVSNDSESDENPISQPSKSQRVDDIELEVNEFQIKSSPSEISFAESSFNYTAEKIDMLPAEEKITEKIKSDNNQIGENLSFTLTLPFRDDKLLKKNSIPKTFNGLKDLSQFTLKRTSSASASNIVNKSVCNKSQSNNKNLNLFTKFSLQNAKSESCEEFTQIGTLDENRVVSAVQAENTVYSKNYLLATDENSEFEMKVSQPEVHDGALVLTNEAESTFDEPMSRHRNYKCVQFDIISLKKELENLGNLSLDLESCNYRKFRSRINPNDNLVAEEELKKEINKESFSQMDIVGQFNLGFIITRLNDDLFIIDQHATDEKYNYETLQKETVLETQKLLNPQSLNLTAVSEAVLLEHMHIFEKNGFRFSINDESSVGDKIKLVSVPVSQNWHFGKEDVDELIFMLTDSTVRMVRPSRVNQMFASRACRKSIMIGTSLTHSSMKKLVLHMGEIEQPWNCPHGRPTMRHLLNLNLLR